MSRIIVVANQKGGVGKTTTVANLGAALTALDKRVLLIDLDPQAALTATFGIDPYKLTHTMASVLLRSSMPFSRILHPVGANGKIALAPGGIDLAAAEVHLATKEDRTRRLQQVLEKNRVPFDIILIDTPPSLGLLTLNGLVAADEVLVPVQSHFLAMRGVRALMETIWRVKRRLNPDLRLLGLLPTMVEPNSRHATEVVEELRTVFKSKVFDVLIIHSVKFAEAPVANQTVVDSAPNHEGAVAYRKLAEEIANHG
ncbi:MAG: ParA family protein [Anaerolineae bacterium]|nr:ParA family protein [Anaerolineae bacterium]